MEPALRDPGSHQQETGLGSSGDGTQLKRIDWSLFRIYTDPAKQEKWERIQLRVLVRSRLGITWKQWLEQHKT